MKNKTMYKKLCDYLLNLITALKMSNKLFRTYFKSLSQKKSILEMHMLLLSHSLEKGLILQENSYRRNKEYGKEKAQKLCEILLDYEKYGCTDYAYIEGRCVLKEYITNQEKNNVNVNSIKEKMDRMMELNNELPAGFEIFEKQTLLEGMQCEFDKLVKTRHSIRNFDISPVSSEIIKKAIELANMSPSACNRQPIEVFYSLKIDKNKELSNCIPGNNGCGFIPCYLIITVKKNYFDLKEFSQWYINGGIYIGNLVLALHSLGIGSCIFQWPLLSKDDEIKEKFGINISNEIIAVVGIGNYLDKNKCLCACKKNSEEMLFEV